MIWFYIAGFISGAVGMLMYANYWVHKHARVIKLPPLEEMKEKDDGTDG